MYGNAYGNTNTATLVVTLTFMETLMVPVTCMVTLMVPETR